MEKIKVLIAEDQALIAKLIKIYLEESDNILVKGIISDGQELCNQLESDFTDVILMDVGLPGLNGIKAAEMICRKHPRIKIIMISSNINVQTIQEAMTSGACGYISKSSSHEDIINAIQTVSKGGFYLCRECAYSLTGMKKEDTTIKNNKLTKREIEILNLISHGLPNHEIADKLCVSKRTIETHRRNILQKFGEKNFVGLMRTVFDEKNGDGSTSKVEEEKASYY